MPVLEIALIICLFAVALSLVLSFLRTGVSPMPSSGKALRATLTAVEIDGEGPVIDLGSGWGILALAFARKYPERRVVGYEVSTVPYLVSVILKLICGQRNLSFYHKDFLETDLSKAALLLSYLSPEGMALLRRKLEKEAGGGALLVSNTFALPSCQPEKTIRLADIYKTPVYVYRFPVSSTEFFL